MNLTKVTFKRLIIHKLIGKTKKADAYHIAATDLHKLDSETEETLKSRINTAVTRSKRFFETKVENTTDGAFWSIAKEIPGSSKKDFISNSKKIAVVAENASQKATIPGGLILVIDAEIDGYDAVIIVKAELQEAFTLRGNAVELIKELFLSPAKEFYKIGILVHKNKRSKQHSAYESFVYDDNFNPGKDDIAEYFYSDFLGFSTSDNDKLKTNNFLKDFLEFVDDNITDSASRKHLKIRIKADYRESSNKIVDPSSYKEFFEDDSKIDKKFTDQILNKYPRSFSKDLTLVDTSLSKSSLHINQNLKIVGDAIYVDEYVDVVNPNSPKELKKLTTTIESGSIDKVVLVATVPLRDQTK